MNHATQIASYVKAAPATAKQIGDLLKLSESRASEVCRALVKDGKLEAVKSGRSFQYRLPNGGTAVAPIPRGEEEKRPQERARIAQDASAAGAADTPTPKGAKSAKKPAIGPVGHKAAKAAKKPSKPTVTKGDDLLDTTPAAPAKKPALKGMVDSMLDTSKGGRPRGVPGVAKVPKPKGEDKRIRSVNGSQARLDALKAYVGDKEHGGWTMAWQASEREWTFKKRGAETKSLLSVELAAYDGPRLVRWLNK